MNHPVTGTIWLCNYGEGVGFKHLVTDVSNGNVTTWSEPGVVNSGWSFHGPIELFVKQFIPIKS